MAIHLPLIEGGRLLATNWLKELEFKEEEKMDYEDFVEALEESKLFDDIVVAESKYEHTKYDDKRIEEIADYLGIRFEE